MIKKMILLCSVALCLGVWSCAPNVHAPSDRIGQAEKALLAGKKTVVAVAVAADELCRQGIIKADTCADIAKAYTKANQSYVLVVDAVLLAQSVDNDANWQTVLTREGEFMALVDDLILLQTKEGK